jgi:hypothetical protein
MQGGFLQILANENTSQALNTASDVVRRTAHSFLNLRSLSVLVLSIVSALIIGRVIAALLRRAVLLIGHRADQIEDLRTVNRLRRYETILVLSIASIRGFLLIVALYFWWQFIHPSGQPTALIGASALAVIIASSVFTPILRDIAAGSFMMAEHWYGVGDHIKVEPFMDVQGVVERVTLRSTRLRGLNGEIIWVNNQTIHGVRLAPQGIRTIGIEMFVTNLDAGEKLIEKTNRRLPIGPMLVISPLVITSNEKVGDDLWHLASVGETAPGREWLLEQSAINLLKELDAKNKTQILAHSPLARYADSEAERRFVRTIKNARKRPKPKKRAASKAALRVAKKPS